MVFSFGKKKESTSCADVVILAGLRQKHGTQFEGAIACLYLSCRDKIMKHLRTRGAGEEDAEDAFQDAIVVLLRTVLVKEAEITNSCGFLFKTALFIWLKQNSRKSMPVRLREGDQKDEGEDLPELEAELDLDLTLEECRMQLPSRAREVIDDFISGLSMDEIAQKRGYKSAQVVRMTKLRAQKDLAECVKSKL